jgi:hypothetical protein
MRPVILLLTLSLLLLLYSCTGKEEKPLTEEERLWQRVDSVKSLAHDGDLITRLNDNIVSHQVRLLNNEDKSFSHGGIVQTINGVKMVTHIDADEPGADTIRYEPIDTFLNPLKNLGGGLFRYDLNDDERSKFIAELNRYHDQGMRFDRIFVVESDSVFYCSEMIYKALLKATNDRIVLPSSYIPPGMLKMVYNYLEKKYPIESIAAEKVIMVDNLYLNPHCKEIMRFRLKQFPGQ